MVGFQKLKHHANGFVSHLLTLIETLFWVFLIISFGLSKYVSNILFQSLGFWMTPDYIIGLRLHSLWVWLGILGAPVILWILFRYTGLLQYETHPWFRWAGNAKRNVFIVVALLIIIVIPVGYLAYTVYDIARQPGPSMLQQIRDGGSPGNPVPDNIFVDSKKTFSVVLYPRNGTWANQAGYSFVQLPKSENDYYFGASILQGRINNGVQEYYNVDMLRYEPLYMQNLSTIKNFSSNGIDWTIYREQVSVECLYAFYALGKWEKDALIQLKLSYDYCSGVRSDELATYHFEKMVASFRLL